LKKNGIDVDSILDEYKMSMGGCFFSRSDINKSDEQNEQILIDDAVGKHLFDVEKLLIIYDQLSVPKKRELFHSVIIYLIKAYKK